MILQYHLADVFIQSEERHKQELRLEGKTLVSATLCFEFDSS